MEVLTIFNTILNGNLGMWPAPLILQPPAPSTCSWGLKCGHDTLEEMITVFDYFILVTVCAGKKTSLKAFLAACLSVTVLKSGCSRIAASCTMAFVVDGRLPWGLRMAGFHRVTGWQPDPASLGVILGLKSFHLVQELKPAIMSCCS